jgi:hypothetical protein
MPQEIGIYKIVSPTGKVYIGQSWDIENRKKKYAGKSKISNQRKLYASLIKYRFNNHSFDVVCTFPEDIEQKVLDEYEIFCINQFKEAGYNMMNIKEGGRGGKLPKESIDKMLTTRGKWNHTEETKKKMSAISMGKTMPPKYIYTIIDKSNTVYTTTCINRFAKEHKINHASHLYKSIKTKRFIKGWLLIDKKEITCNK